MFSKKNLTHENLQPDEEQKNIEQRESNINNTAEFDKVVELGNLEEAENWLNEVKSNRGSYEQYNERWIDHQERKLFKAYYAKEDWVSAKRIVESSVLDNSKEERKKRLIELSGMKYEEIV